ncbi:MAG TPA: SusC/RagA family TonB-linked outer membrane protein [Flavitalea sp.]|nr:SusC/RagA family TonB-linked outer membrane protein [Flavitalea sp.]
MLEANATSFSQSISISEKNVPLESVFKKIEKQTGYYFWYENKTIKGIRKINVELRNASLQEALNRCLAGLPLDYLIVEKTIVIKERPSAAMKTSDEQQLDELLLFEIKGRVTNESGEPLAGATVHMASANKSVVTDANGYFTIEAPTGEVTLTVSYIGYTNQVIAVGNRSYIDVRMTLDQSVISEEVVVTALGISREKKSLGYAVQQVNGDDLTLSKSLDVSSMLAGKVAGLQLAGSPSSSFDNADIIVRGVNGLKPSFPLYVVDGTPTDQANVIMDNVESISVLKGAAATALYGNRAANGVVMITSKKGKRNAAPTVELNLASTFENLYLIPPYQNEYAGGYASSANSPGTKFDSEGFEIFRYNPTRHPAEWAAFDGQRMLEYGADESWGPKINGQEYRPYYSWYPGADFGKTERLTAHPDNTRDFFRTGLNLNNSIAMSGGGDSYNYRLMYANQNRNLVYPGSNRDQHQVGLSSSYDFNKRLTVMTDIAYTTNKTRGKPFEKTRNYDGLSLFMNMNQWFQRQLDVKRLRNYRNPDGSFQTWNIGNPNSSSNPDVYLKPQYWDSPYFIVNEAFNTERTNRLIGNLGFNYKISNVFSLNAYARMNTIQGQGDFRRSTGGVQIDEYYVNYAKTSELNYETNLNFKKGFGDFSLDGFVGGNIRKNKYEFLENGTQGGLIFPDYFAVSASTLRPRIVEDYNAKEVRSLYGKATLGYKNFLYLDATLRNDWSSTLPRDNNSYLYPSVSGSFVFTELMRGSSISETLTFGKVRASYAQVGSDLDFNQVNIAVIRGSQYGNNPSTEIGNEFRSGNIKPTLTKSWEVGAEFGLFNIIGIDFSYYKDNNINQILSIPVAPASGYTTAQINAGNIQRKGWELSVSASPFKRKNNGFSWTTVVNLSKAESFVKELYPGIDQQVFSNPATGKFIVNRVGEKWGMMITRMIRKDEHGRTVFAAANGTLAVTENNKLGSILPDLTGGWFNSLSYKGVDLAFSIDFQKGGRYSSGTMPNYVKTGQAKSTVGVNDKGNDIRSFPSEGGGVRLDGVFNGEPTTVYVNAKKYFSDWVHADGYYNTLDASYIKLREVRLGYSIPTKVLGGGNFIKNINIGVVANNLWVGGVSVRDLGIDPSELESIGEENGQLGATRRVGLNVRVAF